LLFSNKSIYAQNTQIRGFIDVYSTYQHNKLSFGFGEQDLFITSELNDRFTFLGESVFKFSLGSPTFFDVSIERVVLKYNFSGNHNLLFGKHHTPLNYWNDTYHHGKVFFPTIDRPMLFAAGIIPLHTTGISLQGHNLGNIKFGYDLMLGNGIGSSDIIDNDKHKSVTAAVHIKPADGLRIGGSYYRDVISRGVKTHEGHLIDWQVKQQLATGSIAYFGKAFEFLSEATMAINKSDTTNTQNTIGSYAYAGLKINEKWVPYVRIDYLHFPYGEIFYHKDNKKAVVAGLRYNVNYLCVVKLEAEHDNSKLTGNSNKVTAQLAIGF
jgi:hypothetical protein